MFGDFQYFSVLAYNLHRTLHTSRLWPFQHPSVTALVEPGLVSYFALPGGILTSLAPGGFLKTPW